MDTGDLITPSAADASVRPARAADVPPIAAVQARAWRRAAPDLLPAHALDTVTDELLEQGWRAAVERPPSARHAVLVACAGSAVVGFAAAAPCTDPDADRATDAELVALEVDPAHRRSGHGSRLLSAVAGTLRDRGFGVLRVWCPAADRPRQEFLHSAGLRPDGARRELRTGPDSTLLQERLTAVLPAPAP